MLSFILLKLTLREMISDIPHDFGALIVYLLIALFVGFIWYGARSNSGPEEPDPEGDGDHAQ